MKQERKLLTCTVVHEVHDKPTGLTVQVTRNDMSPPGHSLYLGNRPTDGTADERLRPNTRVAATYRPMVDLKSKAQLVYDLWAEAEEWVVQDMQLWVEKNKLGAQLPGRGVRTSPQPGRPAQQYVGVAPPSPKDPVNGPRPDLFSKIPGRAT
jgi:hypothetical protein